LVSPRGGIRSGPQALELAFLSVGFRVMSASGARVRVRVPMVGGIEPARGRVPESGGAADPMELASPSPTRLGAGRCIAARGLVGTLFLLGCGACRTLSLPVGEPVAAVPAVPPARVDAGPAMLRLDGPHFGGPGGRVLLPP